MAFEAVDDALVAGDFGVPSALVCVVAELLDVVELGGDGGDELGGGGEAGAGLADVRVGAGVGSEISGAVAVARNGPMIAPSPYRRIVKLVIQGAFVHSIDRSEVKFPKRILVTTK